jgi:HK97 family phage prohead protease
VFNQDTRINNWEGDFIERISPGAFTKTLDERGDRVKILYDHGLDPSIGNKPLGRPKVIREDAEGLYVEVPLDDTSYNRDLKASLQSGAIDGMSFRFSVAKEEWDDTTNPQTRTLKEVVLHEGGPVTFPAYEGAKAGLRTAEDLQSWRAGHTTTDATTTSSATVEADIVTSDEADEPLPALVNPARQAHTRMQHQLMEDSNNGT